MVSNVVFSWNFCVQRGMSLCLYVFLCFFLSSLSVLLSVILVCLFACLFSNEKEKMGCGFLGREVKRIWEEERRKGWGEKRCY